MNPLLVTNIVRIIKVLGWIWGSSCAGHCRIVIRRKTGPKVFAVAPYSQARVLHCFSWHTIKWLLSYSIFYFLLETEIFALFNKPKTPQKCSQYYTVTIPMRISRNGQTVNSLEANWLEHMTDHFRKGGSLVNAIFSLGMVNGMEITESIMLWLFSFPL